VAPDEPPGFGGGSNPLEDAPHIAEIGGLDYATPIEIEKQY
jgi:hypothetical protein